MRRLVTKYAGECRACAAEIAVGTEVVYEKRVGVFCVGCAPTDTEEIRRYRQEAADRRADRYEGWAEARERRAAAAQKRSDSLMGRDRSPDGRADWALVTQPGYIPQRAQANRAQERAWEEQRAAQAHRERAASARRVVVKGDRERGREAEREKTREWIKKGCRVACVMWGDGTVIRVNKKTATVRYDRGLVDRTCLSWLTPIPQQEG